MLHPQSRAVRLIVLAVGLISISSAAILIRLTSAPPMVIAAYRTGLSVLVLTPFFWLRWEGHRREFAREPRLLLLSVLSGAFLAFHFAFWIESLRRTSVTSSVLLVVMNPIFLGVASPLLLRERISGRTLFAIALGIIGAVVISLRPGSRGIVNTQNLPGNLLALAGSVMYSGYLLLGRRVRRSISIIGYAYCTYGASTLVLLAGVALFGLPVTGFTSSAYLNMLLLALVPQLLGHTSFNWALRQLSAPAVSLVILGEPVGASLLAWLILHQPPTLQEMAGGAIVLSAVAIVAYRETAQTAAGPPAV